MNKILLFSFLLISFQNYSQCTQNASNFGNNNNHSTYNVSGDISVTLNNTATTVTLDFANNFSTASGPDVRVYLINSDGKSDNQIKNSLITDLERISFGEINASGSQTFTANIPQNINISNYDKIFFYCYEFDAFWDFGVFTSFTEANCSSLDVPSETIENFNFQPNPAKNFIKISGTDISKTEIRIFDVLGKQVYHQPKEKSTETINTSDLKSGIYIVYVTEENKKAVKKLVIE